MRQTVRIDRLEDRVNTLELTTATTDDLNNTEANILAKAAELVKHQNEELKQIRADVRVITKHLLGK